MKPSTIFKVALFLSIALTLFVIIAPEFHIIKMGETELVGISYFLVFPFVYGSTGLLSYKKMQEKGKSVHFIPLVLSNATMVFLATFLNVIFPLL